LFSEKHTATESKLSIAEVLKWLEKDAAFCR